MKASIIGLLGLGLLIVIAVLVYVLKGFNPYQPPAPDPEAMGALFVPNSPWGWPQTDSNGNILKDKYGNEKWKGYVYLDETCGIFTAPPSDRFTPGFPTLRSLEMATRIEAKAGVCIDDDQLFARRAKHRCRGDLNLTVRTSGECFGDDGNLYSKDAVEEYWTSCDPAVGTNKTSRCAGSIGLLAWHLQNLTGPSVFDGASCLSVPASYSEDGPIGLEMATCDLRPLDVFGTSRQLFRFQRGSYTRKTGFVESYSGNFVRIIHRKTMRYLAPLEEGPGPLTLVPMTSRFVSTEDGEVDLKGFWWYLLPAAKEPDGPRQSPQALVYLTDPTLVSRVSSPEDLWAQVERGPYVISASGGQARLTVIQIDAENPSEEAKAQYFQFYDYAIIPILMSTSLESLRFSL